MGFKGGFAAFTEGYQRAQERERLIARQEKQDAWETENQERKREEWGRTAKQQAKDDALNAALEKAGGPVEEEVPQAGPVMPDVQGVAAPLAPIKVQRPARPEERYERAAEAYGQYGDVANYAKLKGASEAELMQRSAQAFGQLYNGAGGSSSNKDLIGKAVSIFNSDPGLGQIENVRYGADGSVSFEAVNKRTGQRMPKSFQDPRQLLDDLHGYYSPKSFEAMRAQQSKDANETVVLGAGGRLVKKATGSLVADNPKDGYVSRDADGNETWVSTKTGGAKAGKAPVNAIDVAFEDMTKGAETKFLSNDDYIAARELAKRIHNDNGGKVPVDTAIKTALAVRANPELEVPEVDVNTGMIHMVVKDARNNDVITRPAYAEGKNIKDIKPETVKALVAGMEKKLGAAEFEAIRDVAFDRSGKSARRYLDSQLPKQLAELRAMPAYKNTPEGTLRQIANNYLTQVLEPALMRKAELISMYDTQRSLEGGKRLRYDDKGRVMPEKPAAKTNRFQGGLSPFGATVPGAMAIPGVDDL